MIYKMITLITVILATCYVGVHAQQSRCFDDHELCDFWRGIGECQSNPKWMLRHCMISCRVCEFGKDPPSELTRPSQTSQSTEQRQSTSNSVDSNPVVQERVNTRPSTPRRREERCEQIIQNEFTSSHGKMLDENLVQVVEDSNGMSKPDVERSSRQRGCVPTQTSADCMKNMCMHAMFRSMDGTCNNLASPMKGAAFTQPMRMLPNKFDDGQEIPPGVNSRRPMAREVSATLISSAEIVTHDTANMHAMQWGQFLAHDISKTTLLSESPCSCRGNLVTEQCISARVPSFDRAANRFGCQGGSCCMRLSRSAPVCGQRPKSPLNENTAFVDASMVYGSSVEDMRRLRNGNSGFMRTRRFNGFDFPPTDGSNCGSGTNICLSAGDERVNDFVGLGMLHTIFLREHNRVARQLSSINPQWNGDRVFQEARKIVGAEIQAVTYKEYLPTIMGSSMTRHLPTYSGYDPSADPMISVEFSNGIFRFGHGMIREIWPRLNEDGSSIREGQLHVFDGLLNSEKLVFEGGTAPLIRGMAVTEAKMPQRVTTTITDRLFGNKDLASINIARGRDNGIATYNDMRAQCRMGRAASFDDIAEIPNAGVREKLQRMYESPDNLDLWVGAILEDPVGDAIVGTTMSCVIGDQFRRLRDGDRMFFQRPGVFTEAQRAEIEKMSLAKVMCDNAENLGRVPREMMKRGNVVACNSLPTMNLSVWKEN